MKRLSLLFVLLWGSVLFGETPDYLKYHHAFGIKASNLSGYGAFYGTKLSSVLRIQATGIYYLFDSRWQAERHLIKNYSIGIEVERDFIQEEKERIYLMVGGYTYHDDDETFGNNPFHAIKNSLNGGLGFGYEQFFSRVTLGLELGYKFYWDTSQEQEGDAEWVPVSERVSKLGAGLNLGFIF